ncbi:MULTISPECIES: hypothetical protein [Bacillus]|uniref:hypothetical protein n=1 Tax=Bacillus TaxID=1386 RepID=UPI00036EB4CE|nr:MULTISPECIES: hypothetical protein [Bacillus]MED1473383.1 hypothetical protein [Bacillus pseudomycoides]MED1534853.1 hypothetical protein [Bacillus pseudomycoides]PEO86522.1 hypothetical protein CN571_19435 [Bacillus pseudomycoides]PEP66151.1 hypothetical protein CN564_00130 [Bacillus pseudomycoides]PFW97150.1 hypothetical protein COL29_05215 [Bacillus pseudomycoides]
MNYYKKVQAARSEQEDVGGPDEEAFFASQEGVKWPIVPAAGTGLYNEEWKRLKGIKNKGRASFSQSERSGL